MRSQQIGGVLVGVILLLLAGSNRVLAERPARPNIVLILADDVGREVLGCYGGTSYKTPNLDALASSGMRFDHCYSMPVCHPSRLTIMTGRYPFRNPASWGSWPSGVRTFAHILKDAGYRTAVAGKWQLTLLRNNPDHAQELGFDQSALFGWHEGPRYHNPLIYRNGKIWREVQQPEVFGPEVYCEFLIDFIRANRRGPFFVYYSMALCHEISDDFLPVPPPAPDGHYLSYAEMVSEMDRMVGRLVAEIDKLGLRNRTVIIFTTDNGSPKRYLTDVEYRDGKPIRHHKPVLSVFNGKVVQGGKGTLKDSGTRVPLIVSWPGVVPAGSVCDDLVDFSDFLPTIAELAGIKLPEDMQLDGRSFAWRLTGSLGEARRWVYCSHQGKFWVRTKRWKLYNDGRLFDMQADPDEKRPFLPNSEPPEAAAARKQLLQAVRQLGLHVAENG